LISYLFHNFPNLPNLEKSPDVKAGAIHTAIQLAWSIVEDMFFDDEQELAQIEDTD